MNPPRDRVTNYKALNELDDSLSEAIEIENQAAAYNLDFLKEEPKLKWQESKLTVSQTTIDLEGGD